MKTCSVKLNIPVADGKDCFVTKLGTVLPKGIFKITLDYPLDIPHVFTIQGYITLLSVIKLIIDEYYMIYKNPMKFGVYGHNIGDLVIESLNINYIKKTIKVGIGS